MPVRRRRARTLSVALAAALSASGWFAAQQSDGPARNDLVPVGVAPAPPPVAPAGPPRGEIAGASRPGPMSTGVPAGTDLRPARTIRARNAGAVLEGLDIRGGVTIEADNVTVRRSRVTSGTFWAVYIAEGVLGTVLEDLEIAGKVGCDAGISGGNYTARRLNVHGCSDGVKLGDNTTIEASWIHDLRVTPTSHNDCVQLSGGHSVTVRGNALEAPPWQNSAVFIKVDFGSIDDVLVDGNWLDGGGYTLYVVSASSVTVRNNRFGRRHDFGPASIESSITQSGNVWDDTGRSITL